MSDEMTIDPLHFRAVMGQVPTVVTVVTAIDGEQPHAMVIGSFVSVSLDPPMAGFFCTSTSGTWAALRSANVMGVNVLGADQVDISNACMRPPLERLEGLDWELDCGAPRIAGSAAWLTLRLNTVVETGDHDFALCDVLTMEMADPPREPVIFHGGRYRHLSPEFDHG